MDIIGHRGARGLAPENTVAAMRAGLKNNVAWVEVDARATKDGRVVLHHGPLMHDGSKPLVISRAPYARLAKLPAKQPLATLLDAFDTVAGNANLMIELKTKGCAESVVRAIQAAAKRGHSYDDFMVTSFKVHLLREVHTLDAHIHLGLLHYTRPFRFVHVTNLPLSAVGFWHYRLPRKALALAHQKKLYVYAYNVNSARRAAGLQAIGVDGVVTDYPGSIRS